MIRKGRIKRKKDFCARILKLSVKLFGYRTRDFLQIYQKIMARDVIYR